MCFLIARRTNVQKNRAILLLVDGVVAEDLVVEGLRGRDGTGHDDDGGAHRRCEEDAIEGGGEEGKGKDVEGSKDNKMSQKSK